METKCKLIKERSEVEDKIQLGDQMVQALRTLVVDDIEQDKNMDSLDGRIKIFNKTLCF